MGTAEVTTQTILPGDVSNTTKVIAGTNMDLANHSTVPIGIFEAHTFCSKDKGLAKDTSMKIS